MGRLVLLLIAFPALGHAAPAGIPRDLARRRAAAISNVHYELAFDLRPKAATAPGRETLRFNLTSPQPLRLDYRDGYARRVVVNGSDIPRITANGHIALPRRTPRAGANEVDVEFESGIAPAGKAILRFEDTDDGSEYLYTLFVPMDASMAFPCFDQPDIKSTFKLAVSAPPTWTVISNTAGRRVGEVDEVSTTAFDETQPIPAAGKNARKRAQVAVARKLAVLLNVTGAVAAPSVTGPKSKRAGATASAAGSRVKEAVTVLAASRPTRHAPVPLQPPPFHEANALPGSGVAVSVTRSTENVAAQAGPHSIPAGSDATEPAGTGLRDGQRDGTRTLERRRGRAAGARGDGQRGALNEADRRGREPDAERAARAGVDASGQSFDEATKSAVSLRARDSLPVAAWPRFCTVNRASALRLPRGTRPKPFDVGVMVIWPGVSAVPVTVAAIGLLPSPTVSVASLGPAAPTGWKATRTVQLPPAATVAPGQVPPVTAKSSASLNMTARAPLVLPPSLVTVSASGDDVSPSATEATSRVAGAIESTGGGASVTGASGDGASAGAAASGIDASGVSAAPGRTHRFVPGWHTKLCGHAPFEPQASSAAATSGLVQAAQSTATTRRDPKLPMRRRGKHGRCRRWRK